MKLDSQFPTHLMKTVTNSLLEKKNTPSCCLLCGVLWVTKKSLISQTETKMQGWFMYLLLSRCYTDLWHQDLSDFMKAQENLWNLDNLRRVKKRLGLLELISLNTGSAVQIYSGNHTLNFYIISIIQITSLLDSRKFSEWHCQKV